MNDTTEMTEIDNSKSMNTTTDFLMDSASMNAMHTMSKIMSSAVATIPKHLQGNNADCMAVVMQAAQWKMNPFAVAQKTHLVNGVLGYESQLVNAVISSSRAIKGRFKYEYEGTWKDDRDPSAKVRCGAILSGESEITWGEWLWPKAITTKNSPLWKTAPKQQSAYLALKYWARLYTPDVLLGVYTPEELEDVGTTYKDVNPMPESSLSEKYNQPDVVDIVDTETGEVTQEIDVGELKDKIEMSESQRQLNDLLPDLSGMTEGQDKADMRELYQAKAKVLKS